MVFEDEVDLLEIPASFVDLDFVMDPKTEDVIFGDELEDGMVVLIQESILRGESDRLDPNHLHYSIHAVSRILSVSRWCRVTKLRKKAGIVFFIGLYADGTKHSRSYSMDHTWVVKK